MYKLVENKILYGVVKAVHDGDSYKIQFPDETVWVRLHGCDSPEVISNHVLRDQPHGRKAGDKVREFIKGKEVKVEVLFKDQYDRWICRVWSEEVNLTDYIIENGLGWYLKEPKMKTYEIDYLKSKQEQAKVSYLGLWSESGRKVRPSTWRNQNRRYSLTENKEFPDLW